MEFREKFILQSKVFSLGTSDYEVFIDELRQAFGDDISYPGFLLTAPFPDTVDDVRFIEVELQYYDSGIFVLIRFYDLYIVAFRKKSDALGTWYVLKFDPVGMRKFILKKMPRVKELRCGESYGDFGGLKKVKMGVSGVGSAIQTLDHSSKQEDFSKPLGLICVFLSESVRDRRISAEIVDILREFKEVNDFGNKWDRVIHSWSARSQNAILEHMKLRTKQVLTPVSNEDDLGRTDAELGEFGIIHREGYDQAMKTIRKEEEEEKEREKEKVRKKK